MRISDWSSDVCSSDLPAEASHGDLGMITDADVVLVLSNSGETEQVLTILPMLKRQGNAMVAMTGRPQSNLARHAAAHLDVRVPLEAPPLGFAPTAPTTAALAVCVALAEIGRAACRERGWR